MKTRIFLYFYLILLIFSPFVGYVSITWLKTGPLNIFTALTFLLFFIFILDVFESRKKIHIPKYLWFYIAFLLYTVLSDIFLVGKSIGIKYLFSKHMLPFILVMIVIENSFFAKKVFGAFIKLAILVILTALIVILVQQFINTTFFVDLYKENVVGYLNTNLSYALRLPSIYSWIGLLEMGFSFIPVLAIIMEYYLLKNKRPYIWIIFFILGVIYVFLTRSRWIMLNMFTLLLIPLFHYRMQLRKVVVNSIFVISIVYVTILLSANFGVPVYDIIENRILEKSHGGLEQGSASTRILAFYVFGKLFPEHPIFGKGDFHTFDKRTDKDFKLAAALGGRSSQIHVGYLSLLYYYGIVGGSFFLLSLYYLMKRLYRDAKKTKHWAPFYGLLGYVLANLTLVEFSLFHAGLILALVCDKYFLQQYYIKEAVNKHITFSNG